MGLVAHLMQPCCDFYCFKTRAETEAKITGQKDEDIKKVEAEILQLKSDIYNLKVFIEQKRGELVLLKFCRMFTGNSRCMGNFWQQFHLRTGGMNRLENSLRNFSHQFVQQYVAQRTRTTIDPAIQVSTE